MKCISAVTLESDMPFWVPRFIFEREFDQADFLYRNQKFVEGVYLKHWFDIDEEENNRFLLPTVNIVSGKTQFVNGRHRAAVLSSE